ncbi:MAG: hypothetical protein Tsb0013_20570 [Phycisphaerales bacterium]
MQWDDQTKPRPGSVESTTPCEGCGYDLRGLPTDGYCPECGRPVADTLRHAPHPDFVRTVQRGLRFVFWAMIVQYAGGFAFGIAIAVIGFVAAMQSAGSGGQPSASSFLPYTIASNIVNLVLAVVTAIGWWILTAPVPGVRPEHDAPRARNGVRVAYIFHLLITIAALIRLVTNPPSYQPQGGGTISILSNFPIDDLLLGLLALIVYAVLIAMQAMHLRTIARTIPGHRGESLANTSVWLLPLLASVGVLACGLGPLVAAIILIVLCGVLLGAIKPYASSMPHRPF